MIKKHRKRRTTNGSKIEKPDRDPLIDTVCWHVNEGIEGKIGANEAGTTYLVNKTGLCASTIRRMRKLKKGECYRPQSLTLQFMLKPFGLGLHVGPLSNRK